MSLNASASIQRPTVPFFSDSSAVQDSSNKGNCSSASSAGQNLSSSNAADAISISGSSSSSFFASPKKRARTRGTPNPEVGAELRVVTAQQFHTQDACNSDAFLFRGAVLNLEEPRMVSITDRKTKSQMEIAIVSILLADSTGPITMELWREQAEIVFRNLNLWTGESNDTVWVEVRHMWCRAEKGICIPSMRKLVGNDRTSVTQCALVPVTATSISESLHIRDFFCFSFFASFFCQCDRRHFCSS